MSLQSTTRARRSRRFAVILAAAIAGFALAALSGIAIAKSGASPVKTTHNAKLGESILVAANGMTLYELAPETKSHLLCTSAQCLQFWPALKTHSAKTKLHAGPGVKGKLRVLHRHGFSQVMLNGRPLYFFAGDKAKGDANGRGLKTFGGTWHVVKAAQSAGSPSQSSTPSTTTMPPYSY
jgi:predicted lipoprotein with Yx(FWY)xxD motif